MRLCRRLAAEISDIDLCIEHPGKRLSTVVIILVQILWLKVAMDIVQDICPTEVLGCHRPAHKADLEQSKNEKTQQKPLQSVQLYARPCKA